MALWALERAVRLCGEFLVVFFRRTGFDFALRDFLATLKLDSCCRPRWVRELNDGEVCRRATGGDVLVFFRVRGTLPERADPAEANCGNASKHANKNISGNRLTVGEEEITRVLGANLRPVLGQRTRPFSLGVRRHN